MAAAFVIHPSLSFYEDESSLANFFPHTSPKTSYSTRFASPATCSAPQSHSMFSGLRRKLSRSPSKADSSTSKSQDKSSENNSNPFRNKSSPTRRPNNMSVSDATSELPPPYAPSSSEPIQAAASDSRRPIPIYESQSASATHNAEEEDKYGFLRTFDTKILIDDSTSMMYPMRHSSWEQCGEVLEALVPIVTARDEDGIDIHFLNAPDTRYKNIKDSTTVHEIFSIVSPRGMTPSGQKLNRLLKDYIAEFTANPKKTKPLNIIFITDGAPSDDVESPIINAAKKLDQLGADAWQLGIQMLQVGDDSEATEHLEQLDDELSERGGGCRDIVDTVPYKRGRTGANNLTAEVILKVVLGAVNKKLDRKSADAMVKQKKK